MSSSRKFVTQLFDALGAHAGAEHDASVARNRNPLEAAGGEAKKQLLALHVAFPNELLPALDLLDRSLVTRLRIRRDKEDLSEGAASAPQDVRGHVEGRPTGGTATPGNNDNEGRIIAGPHPPPDGLGRPASSDAEMQEAPLPCVPEDEESVSQHKQNEMLDTVYYVRSAQQRSSRYSTSFDTLTSYEVRLTAWNCSCPAFAFSAFPPVHPEPPVAVYEPGRELRAEGNGWNFGGVSLGEGIPPVCKHLLACVLAERCEGLFGGRVEEKVISVEEAAGWAAGWGD
ncbi:hypothetical protein SLS60_005945 [Paraconiothyrium brasiliense]|uniref:SWIM-type domain-containing protein n=1 Tax=Paraconiothyrium brasiliense TaxID=300254 RepID=A0ABR3RDL3_9PLEO